MQVYYSTSGKLSRQCMTEYYWCKNHIMDINTSPPLPLACCMDSISSECDVVQLLYSINAKYYHHCSHHCVGSLFGRPAQPPQPCIRSPCQAAITARYISTINQAPVAENCKRMPQSDKGPLDTREQSVHEGCRLPKQSFNGGLCPVNSMASRDAGHN